MATSLSVEDHRSRWHIGRITICGLALLFVVFPAIMDIPPHEQMTAPVATTENAPAQLGIKGTCPPIDLCKDVTVEQALPRLPVPPLPLFALVMLILAMRWQPRAPTPQRDWWLPPDRRRALLQVFLI